MFAKLIKFYKQLSHEKPTYFAKFAGKQEL